jgi:hypothetical protein
MTLGPRGTARLERLSPQRVANDRSRRYWRLIMTDFLIPTDGPIIATEADFTDFIGEAAWGGFTRIVVPVARLSPDFFKLSTGLAGAILQKCTNYQLQVAIVGDISAHTEKSGPLRDFIYESNKRGAVRFVGSISDL